MSNIVDAFTHSPVYTNIMEDCKESLAGAIPWGFFHAKITTTLSGGRVELKVSLSLCQLGSSAFFRM